MIPRVLRRNGRTASKASPAHPPRCELLLLAISLVVFFGGFASLAWALGEYRIAATPQPSEELPKKTAADDAPYQYRGELRATEQLEADGQENGEAPEPISTPTAPPSTEVPDPDINIDGENDGDLASSGPMPASETPARESPAARTRTIIHHTAYREELVCRTVHHQASIAREVAVDGKTRIEWSLCPVCMERHDAAFNERLVDSVSPVPCIACGARHESSYDEVIE